MTKMANDRAYTVNEVADILGVHPYTVRELLKNGRMKGVKINTQWRITPEELDKFMNPEKSCGEGDV